MKITLPTQLYKIEFFLLLINHHIIILPTLLYHDGGLSVLRAILYRERATVLHQVRCPSSFKAWVSPGNIKTVCLLWEQRMLTFSPVLHAPHSTCWMIHLRCQILYPRLTEESCVDSMESEN